VNHSKPSDNELLALAIELKQIDRLKLAKLDPSEAQAMAESVLDPSIGSVVDVEELAWPGDLADDWEPKCG
jgi:hypothetical protein